MKPEMRKGVNRRFHKGLALAAVFCAALLHAGAAFGAGGQAGTGLKIAAGSVREMGGEGKSTLNIAGYRLFSGDGESRYGAAQAKSAEKDRALRESLFTENTPAFAQRVPGAEEAASLGILEAIPEYNQGVYDEEHAQNHQARNILLVAAGLCALCFLGTRLFVKQRRRHADVHQHHD
ncbi:MAG: hypothetical protein LBS91_07185 [Clostridiales Family XIII bacterium]|jgi:hypothetical protein|nr:hypothetical protein [Clostridiales Family XIII bacterium]